MINKIIDIEYFEDNQTFSGIMHGMKIRFDSRYQFAVDDFFVSLELGYTKGRMKFLDYIPINIGDTTYYYKVTYSPSGYDLILLSRSLENTLQLRLLLS